MVHDPEQVCVFQFRVSRLRLMNFRPTIRRHITDRKRSDRDRLTGPLLMDLSLLRYKSETVEPLLTNVDRNGPKSQDGYPS